MLELDHNFHLHRKTGEVSPLPVHLPTLSGFHRYPQQHSPIPQRLPAQPCIWITLCLVSAQSLRCEGFLCVSPDAKPQSRLDPDFCNPTLN